MRLSTAGSVLLTFAALTIASAQVSQHFANPEDGGIKNGAYDNPYFGLHYPLLAGWSEDLKGPVPSITGYYSLISLKPEGILTATLLISTQDDFFSPEPAGTAMEFVRQMSDHLDPTLTATEPPAETTIAGHTFAHFTYSGAALYHSIFATNMRCHTLIFSLTSGSLERIDELTASLNRMSFVDVHAPVCIRDYASPEHITRQVAPAMIGPRFGSVPVRIVIGPQGNVDYIHAIAGFPDQMKSVLDALAQWQFKPYVVNGKAEEVETGILFQFPQKEQ